MTIKTANNENPTMQQAQSFELIHTCNGGWIIRDENKEPTQVFSFSTTKDLTEFLMVWGMTEIVVSLDDQKPDVSDDEWIEWKGGERPVFQEDMVHVKFRNGEQHKNKAFKWDWRHYGDNWKYEIVAYRVVPQ